MHTCARKGRAIKVLMRRPEETHKFQELKFSAGRTI